MKKIKTSSKGIVIASLVVSLSVLIPIFTYFKFPFGGILVHGDDDFKRYNFPGEGTAENPYRIENKKFKFKTNDAYDTDSWYHYSETAIQIDHTTKHVIISDCTFEGAFRGIYLNYLPTGRVQIYNCTFTDCYYGISGRRIQEGVDIIDNEFNLIRYSGSFEDINNCIISKNHLLENYAGFSIFSGDDMRMYNFLIENNTITNTLRHGFAFVDTFNMTIRNNFLVNSSFRLPDDQTWSYGEGIDSLIFENNFVNEKIVGFFIDLNNVTFTEQFGQFFLYDCSNIIILNQDMISINRGILASRCTYLTIANSTFDYRILDEEYSNQGMHFLQCLNIVFSNISFIEGYSYTMYHLGSNYIYIRNCSFYKTRRSCLAFDVSYYGEVVDNTFLITEDADIFTTYSHVESFTIANNTISYI